MRSSFFEFQNRHQKCADVLCQSRYLVGTFSQPRHRYIWSYSSIRAMTRSKSDSSNRHHQKDRSVSDRTTVVFWLWGLIGSCSVWKTENSSINEWIGVPAFSLVQSKSVTLSDFYAKCVAFLTPARCCSVAPFVFGPASFLRLCLLS